MDAGYTHPKYYYQPQFDQLLIAFHLPEVTVDPNACSVLHLLKRTYDHLLMLSPQLRELHAMEEGETKKEELAKYLQCEHIANDKGLHLQAIQCNLTTELQAVDELDDPVEGRSKLA